MYINMYVYKCVLMHIYAHTHTHTHTHIHAHTHTSHLVASSTRDRRLLTEVMIISNEASLTKSSGFKSLQCVAVCRSVPQCAAVCRSVSQCVAACCSVLQRVVTAQVKIISNKASRKKSTGFKSFYYSSYTHTRTLTHKHTGVYVYTFTRPHTHT